MAQEEEAKNEDNSNGWGQYVKAAQDLGFKRVCIIARKDYTVMATTDPKKDIPTSYKDRDDNIVM